MRKIILSDKRPVWPFNEPARELRVLNKPLWLHQHDLLTRYASQEVTVNSFDELGPERTETFAYRENLFFDQSFLEEFISKARRLGRPCQVAFPLDDKAIVTHALPMQNTIRREGDLYVSDMWYFPRDTQPLIMHTEPHEVGYYHVPTHMSNKMGDLVYHLPTKAFMAIETWVHVLIANVVFGTFSRGARFERDAEQGLGLPLKLLWHAVLYQLPE